MPAKPASRPLAGAAFLASLALSGTVAARADYVIKDLGIRGDFQTSARAMNNQGMVVGVSGVGITNAFLYDGKAVTATSPGTLEAINNPGQAVGFTTGRFDGKTYSATVGLPALYTHADSSALGLNDRGMIVGFDHLDPSKDLRPFVATPDATSSLGYSMVHPLDASGNVVYGSANAVSASGMVAGTAHTAGGTSAFLWTPPATAGGTATFLDLSTFPHLSGHNTAATAMNASGMVVGTSDDPSNPGFLFDHNRGTVTDLSFAPASINASGQVVGGTFLYRNGVTTDFSTFDLGHNYHVLSLAAINDSGQILVNAYDPVDTIDGFNPTHGVFILTPMAVPEPASMALLAIGGLGMLAVGRLGGRKR